MIGKIIKIFVSAAIIVASIIISLAVFGFLYIALVLLGLTLLIGSIVLVIAGLVAAVIGVLFYISVVKGKPWPVKKFVKDNLR